MDDDSKLLGLVLGATLSVSLGLFTVALCHYLGVARLMLALSSTEPSSYTWMYPAFAKAIYLDASGCATHVPIGEAYDVHSRALNWRLPYVCVRCIQILEALRGPWPVSWRGGIPAASTTRSLKVEG